MGAEGGTEAVISCAVVTHAAAAALFILVIAEGLNFASKRFYLRSVRSDLGSERVARLGPERTNLGSERTELGSQRLDLGSGRPELGELGSGSPHLRSERSDAGSERPVLEPKRHDVVSERPDNGLQPGGASVRMRLGRGALTPEAEKSPCV